ncbi:hypothetical protein [Halorubrum vacuolatum]|uniref:Uncharacterized protein n=1 Tax=Halorubrum vacuolatum TaxID=63740 RepID=A0A238W907_HALVU|nr:hypothetical protein [Halorubrum vacuolatum]SNR43075.1 hypothetical protein SAMN06264855_10660 [Halorubrum vacuolatum]
MPRPNKQIQKLDTDWPGIILILCNGDTLFGKCHESHWSGDEIELISLLWDRYFEIPKDRVAGIYPITASQEKIENSVQSDNSPLIQNLSKFTERKVNEHGFNTHSIGLSYFSSIDSELGEAPQVNIPKEDTDKRSSDTDAYGEKVKPVDRHYGGPPPSDDEEYDENDSLSQETIQSVTHTVERRGEVWAEEKSWFEEGFDWGAIEFDNDTPLYCDWDFLTRKQGKTLNSLGAGALGLSLSAGWDTQLWSDFQNKVDESKTPIQSISNEHEVTVVGHTQFISLGGGGLSMTMEGDDWYAAIISPSPIKKIDQLSDYDWAIVFFKSDCFMFPKSLWDQIEERMNVYGDVVSTNFSTPIGEAKCFVKARACAYIED